MSLLHSTFLNYVVALGVPDSDDEDSIEFVGTGFLYGYSADKGEKRRSQYYPYLVTNRHVLDESGELTVRLNGRKSSVLWSPEFWLSHPDPKIDVAVAPFNIVSSEDSWSWFCNDKNVYFREELKNVGFAEGDEVYTLGYPLGLVGDERNYVIARQGIVARIRDWYDSRSDTFLIDALIYPGNSGGPVIAKPTMFSYVTTRPYPKLIGMVSKYVEVCESVQNDQSGEVVSISTDNSGLAKVVPIDKVNETIEDVLERYTNVNGK